jgi:hypothetical protein
MHTHSRLSTWHPQTCRTRTVQWETAALAVTVNPTSKCKRNVLTHVPWTLALTWSTSFTAGTLNSSVAMQKPTSTSPSEPLSEFVLHWNPMSKSCSGWTSSSPRLADSSCCCSTLAARRASSASFLAAQHDSSSGCCLSTSWRFASSWNSSHFSMLTI